MDVARYSTRRQGGHGEIAPWVQKTEIALKDEAQRGEFFAGGCGVPVENRVDPQSFCDLAEQRPILDIGDLRWVNLCDIERQAIDVQVGFAEMDEGGNHKEVHKILEVEAADPVFGDFAAFVADDGDAQTIYGTELFNETDHVVVGGGLFENVAHDIFRRVFPWFEEYDLPQIGFERHFPLLVGVVGYAVTVIQFIVIHLKMFGGLLAQGGIPAVGEENASDVEEQGCDFARGCHGGW